SARPMAIGTSRRHVPPHRWSSGGCCFAADEEQGSGPIAPGDPPVANLYHVDHCARRQSAGRNTPAPESGSLFPWADFGVAAVSDGDRTDELAERALAARAAQYIGRGD